MELIHFLNVGKYVFDAIGFGEVDLAGKYIFDIKANFGELWKLTGTTGLIGKLIVDPYKKGNYELVINNSSNCVSLKDLDEPIRLLTQNVWDNYKPKK